MSQEAGLSRETLRIQKNKAIKAIKESLKDEKRGRKPKDYVAGEKNQAVEIERLKRELEEAKKAKKVLEKENRGIMDQLFVAKHALKFWEKEGRVDLKKNPTLQKVINNIYSEAPKKLSKPEEK